MSGPAAAVEALDRRDNAITPMRLLLAGLVLVSHAFVVGGFGLDPMFGATGGQLQLGTAAVLGFFGLSGYLLARSRQELPVLGYARNRLLRIVPALWVCVGVVAFAVVPIAVAMGGTADPAQVAAWAVSAMTFQIEAVPVVGLYAGNVLPDWVNGPLWTLPPEVLCYVMLGAIPARMVRAGGLFVLVLAALANAATGGDSLYLHLPVAFFAGVALYAQRDRLPITTPGVLIAVAATAVGLVTGTLTIVAPLTIPYLAVVAGLRAPIRMRRDLSYGVYIYAWPVQQLLAMAGVAALGVAAYAAAAGVVVVGLALVSWTVVEKPALRLRSRAARTAAPLPAGAVVSG